MSIARMTDVWNYSIHRYSTLLALLSIADQARDDGFAFPGTASIAARARVEKRHIYRILKRIEDSRELYISRRAGKHKNHLYLVTVGQSLEDICAALNNRFDLTEDDVRTWFVTMPGQPDKLSGDNLSGVTWSHVDRDNLSPSTRQGVTLIMTPESPESLINLKDKNNKSLVSFSDFPDSITKNPILMYRAFIDQLRNDMAKATFDKWVRDTQVYNYEDLGDAALFYIAANNELQREWLEARLASTATRLLTGIAAKRVEITFICP